VQPRNSRAEETHSGIRFDNPETGGRWKDLWLGLKKACRKAGLNDVTWHTFRHTFASRLTGKWC
jgi:integrase